jgi:PIN domain nuclease of toxin-antitoxin system
MLVDTNVLIWYGLAPQRLSKLAVRKLGGSGNYYSHASLWELAIKSSLGKIDLLEPDGQHTSAGSFLLNVIGDLELSSLPLEFDDLANIEELPFHHKDPFDRLLVVQAKRLAIPILSSDPVFEKYGVKRVW